MTAYTLISPVEHAGKTYSELTFREVVTGDLIAADTQTGETGKMVAILASASDVPLPAFKKIKIHDFKAIMAMTAGLMGELEGSTAAGI